MGSTTDLFVARAEEAGELGRASPEELRDRWECVSLDGVEDVALGALAVILRGKGHAYEPEVLFPEGDGAAGDDVTRDGLDDGVYVVRLPDAFIAAVAALADDRVGEVAAAWRSAASELRDSPKARAVEVLLSLRDLARRATMARKAVLSVFEI